MNDEEIKVFLEEIPDGIEYIVGIDEVGRGPLAGPVTVGLFMMSVENMKSKIMPKGVTDSKKLTEKKREEIVSALRALREENECAFTIDSHSASQVDRMGIASCIKKSIARGLKKLDCDPQKTFIFLDGGLYAPSEFEYQATVVKGDYKIKVIGAASIVAKVWRDTYMIKLSQKFPEYSFQLHKGYATKVHREAIMRSGLTDEHRQSFIHFA